MKAKPVTPASNTISAQDLKERVSRLHAELGEILDLEALAKDYDPLRSPVDAINRDRVEMVSAASACIYPCLG